MMAKLFEPETEVPETYGKVKLDIPKTDVNLLDAAARGTGEGLAPHAQRHRHAGRLRGARGAAQRRFRRRARLAAVVSRQPADRARLDLPADRLGHGRAVARQRHHRRPARHPHGAERVHRLRGARPAQGLARPALVHHRVVRAGGLRQLQLGRHPARRHRRAASRSASTISPGSASAPCSPARSPTSSRRRSPASCCMSAGAGARRPRWTRPRPRSGKRLGSRRPASAIVLGSGLGSFAEQVATRSGFPTATSRISRCPPSMGHAGELVAGTLAGKPVLVQSGRFHLYEGHPAGDGRRCRSGLRDARHRHADPDQCRRRHPARASPPAA